VTPICIATLHRFDAPVRFKSDPSMCTTARTDGRTDWPMIMMLTYGTIHMCAVQCTVGWIAGNRPEDMPIAGALLPSHPPFLAAAIYLLPLSQKNTTMRLVSQKITTMRFVPVKFAKV